MARKLDADYITEVFLILNIEKTTKHNKAKEAPVIMSSLCWASVPSRKQYVDSVAVQFLHGQL